MKRLSLIALWLSLSGCPKSSAVGDGGTIGDSGTVGQDGGTVGQDGGTVCQDGGFIPLDQYCLDVSTGFVNAVLAEYAFCGEPLTAADVSHLPIVSGSASTWGPLFNAVATCSLAQDGGLTFGSQIQLLVDRVDAGLMAYDGCRAAQCRALGRASGSGVVYDAGALSFCTDVFLGLVPLGGACDRNEECAAGYCGTGGSACAGTCKALVTAGAPCDPALDVCIGHSTCASSLDGGGFACNGQSALGGRCLAASDCQAGLLCESGSQKCIAGAAGDTCFLFENMPSPLIGQASNASCLPGLICVSPANDAGAAGTCQPLAQLGQACDPSSAGSPLCATRCTACVAGRCQPLGNVGATCTRDSDCLPSLECSPGTSSCVLRGRPGDGCRVSPDAGNLGTSLPSDCLYADSFCQRASASSTTGTCVRQPAVGQACGNSFDTWPQCADPNVPGAYCAFTPPAAAGTCQPPPAIGQACGTSPGESYACIGGACVPVDGGTSMACEPHPTVGQSCAQDSQCATGYCATVVDAGYVCLAPVPYGSACSNIVGECGSGTCSLVTRTCVVQCEPTYSVTGCTDGLRDFSWYLLYALVLAPAAVRRRRSGRRAA